MTYKDLCGKEKRVWIELGENRRDKIKILRFLKGLGCKWVNGAEIAPRQNVGGYISLHSDGSIAHVGMWSWVAWHLQGEESRTKVIDYPEFKQIMAAENKK